MSHPNTEIMAQNLSFFSNKYQDTPQCSISYLSSHLNFLEIKNPKFLPITKCLGGS
jgi:hypothetical protein